ncbi:hypothetical protein FQU76_19380 [Streptomyces qinzhouensis]|uniref:Uncharacterized protein n=1 Tax=Streptomyces qinzhouensis TaxID=2599401 RepID=A0A5B8JAC4_9ACTN|nr:hypothetical protein FQU76_19380 [Streptomyces qinzhouensis]
MTHDALVNDAPEPLTAWCVHCGRRTSAPVEVGVMERGSSAPLIQYACPEDAVRYGAGPSPADEIR